MERFRHRDRCLDRFDLVRVLDLPLREDQRLQVDAPLTLTRDDPRHGLGLHAQVSHAGPL